MRNNYPVTPPTVIQYLFWTAIDHQNSTTRRPQHNPQTSCLHKRYIISLHSIMNITTKEAGRWLEALSLFGTGIAAGFTYYITKIEIPSRKDDTGAYNLTHYQHVFPSSAVFMKPFGVVLNGLMGGAIYTTRKGLWWIPFVCVGALGPFTVFAIVDTNNTLMGMKPTDLKTPEQDAKAKELVTKWGQLHNIRTGFSLVGFAAAIVAALDLAV